MKKTRLLLFLAILLCSNKVFAEEISFSADNEGKTIYYTTNEGTNTVRVVWNESYRNKGNTAFVIPSSVTNPAEGGLTYDVTAIGTQAFYYSPYLTSITIPNSVTSIAYQGLANCDALTSITIPSSVTTIDNNAFDDDDALESIIIPSTVTTIGEFAFNSCDKLSSVTISQGIPSIGKCAFKYCPALSSITIPSSVTSIGDGAFSNSGLTAITIPNTVTTMGVSIFSSCLKLTSVTIQSGVTSIGVNAFDGCSGLTSITIPNTVASIGESAFSGSGLTSIAIPSSVNLIGQYAFSKCSKLSTVTIPSSVSSIPKGTFQYCTALKSITIPSSVTRIEALAFEYSGLTSITIPSSVTYIGSDAFYWCPNLATVNSLIEDPAGVLFSNETFQKQSGKVATLNVPFGSSTTYSGIAGWSATCFTTTKEAAFVTITSAGYATYCNAKNLDFSADDGLDAFLATAYTSPILTVTKYDQIPANTGMLLKGDAGVYPVYEATSASTVASLLEGTTVAISNLPQIDGLVTNFVLSSVDDVVGFYKVATGGIAMAANSAYLPLPTANIPGASKKLVVNFNNQGGQTTDIKTVELNKNLDDTIYNLQGQKVVNPERGIYIIKGKKTYIK